MSSQGPKYLILGASSDIGLALIKSLGQRISDGSRCLVIAHYHRSGDGLRALCADLPIDLELLKADFGSAEEIAQLVRTTRELIGCPTHIVHLPASRPRQQRFRDCDWFGSFKQELSIQVQSFAAVAQAFLPDMARQRCGNVVVMLSSYVQGLPPAGLAPYVTAKYALLGLLRSLVAEYRGKGLNINAVSPSMIETAFLEHVPPLAVEMAREAHPMKRLASTEDIVPLLVFLLSSAAGYINGQNILVDGGAY